ncbi:MFS transporter [Pararobbsia silviterrae]|uniref:MFS transporter n=1 Tax=Pararobbsia silviterrae TaxID=1792498 RepID=A0A494XRM0_9BURK|nr:MFS transporter [Pararobbsia silviterrae]RKP53297.1 MFS transporter [Pararobbsia silviterrae]
MQPTPNSPTLQRALQRTRRRLIPLLILMYLLGYLDRANIAYAKQAFQQTTGVTEAAFAFSAGLFFVGYALFELPSNLLLQKVGARIWLSRIMVTWGILAAGIAFATSNTSFSTVRVLLGIAEAGFFPGVLVYLGQWFPARERARIIGLFYLSQPICFIVGGPLSGGLLELDGLFGLHGWQLMFLCEGLAASLVGLFAFFYLTDKPASASWLPADEKAALVATLAQEEATKIAAGHMRLGKALRDPMLLQFGLIYFSIAICGYGVAFYLPSIVGSLLGQHIGFKVSLVTAIPWLCALAACTFWPGLAAKTGRRRTFTVISLLCAGFGMVASGYLPPILALGALCVSVAGVISAQPIFWTFPSSYYGGYAAAGGIAIVNAIGNLGGFAAPTFKVTAEAHAGTPLAGLWVMGAGAVLAAVIVALIPRRADALTSRDTPSARDHEAAGFPVV